MHHLHLLLLLSLATASMCRAGLIYGTNAIANPGAEDGVGSSDGINGGTTVPGWTLTGNFHAVQYGVPGGWPLSSDPGPAARGRNFFSGGPSNGSSKATQLVDTANVSGDIDTGLVSFVLAGWLGGFDGQDDNAILSASFLSGSSSTLGYVQVGPVTAAERLSSTGFLFRSLAGLVPVGTRSIAFELQMTRTSGSYNDGYADNLSFVATAPVKNAVPEPSGLLLVPFVLALGLTVRQVRSRL